MNQKNAAHSHWTWKLPCTACSLRKVCYYHTTLPGFLKNELIPNESSSKQRARGRKEVGVFRTGRSQVNKKPPPHLEATIKMHKSKANTYPVQDYYEPLSLLSMYIRLTRVGEGWCQIEDSDPIYQARMAAYGLAHSVSQTALHRIAWDQGKIYVCKISGYFNPSPLQFACRLHRHPLKLLGLQPLHPPPFI